MRYSTISRVRNARCIDAPATLKRSGISPAYRGFIVKSLLHMRRAPASNGAAHQFHFEAPDVPHSQSAQIDEEPTSDSTPSETPGPSPVNPPLRPVTPLHAVQLTPAQANGRAVQLADAAEVERMLDNEELTVFHIFRTFDYSVNLLFYPRELKYFVALLQDDQLWRVLTTSDLNMAKQLFHHMQEQATRLADDQTRRLQLEAHNEQLKRLIAESETQAERLRQSLQRTSAQDQTVTSRQHQLRKEVAQLEAQRTAAQAQLNKMHRQVHQLNVASNEAIPHMPR
ncbi:Protein of unknown function [Paraburkholderia diazotrophica]|uniref:DUF2968 family protein n=1 Tax=Paraburkholderia diazotrophica TaxID=667676 RepID=A0A1H7AW91_9BURK|nr:Protein of unknown function [Paraburkholderia diazotrophica]